MAVISCTAIATGRRTMPSRYIRDVRTDTVLTGRHMLAAVLQNFYWDRLRECWADLRRMGVATREGEAMTFRKLLRYCFAREA